MKDHLNLGGGDADKTNTHAEDTGTCPAHNSFSRCEVESIVIAKRDVTLVMSCGGRKQHTHTTETLRAREEREELGNK